MQIFRMWLKDLKQMTCCIACMYQGLTAITLKNKLMFSENSEK